MGDFTQYLLADSEGVDVTIGDVPGEVSIRIAGPNAAGSEEDSDGGGQR